LAEVAVEVVEALEPALMEEAAALVEVVQSLTMS
jgi:hypothetical protein